jgi:hypothetical protein
MCSVKSIDPPTETTYFLSSDERALIFIVGVENAIVPFSIRSAIPGNILDPPEKNNAHAKVFPLIIIALHDAPEQSLISSIVLHASK